MAASEKGNSLQRKERSSNPVEADSLLAASTKKEAMSYIAHMVASVALVALATRAEVAEGAMVVVVVIVPHSTPAFSDIKRIFAIYFIFFSDSFSVAWCHIKCDFISANSTGDRIGSDPVR